MAPHKRHRILAGAAAATVLLGAPVWYTANDRLARITDNANYDIHFAKPDGWKELPHAPQTLFLYRHPKNGLLIRGAMSQMISSTNPTPELDTEGIADYFVDRTRENMPDWEVAKLDLVPAQGTRFRMIRREKKDQIVINAYAVKGNTTLLVSLSGRGEFKPEVDSTLPELRQYLSTIAFRPSTKYVPPVNED